MNINIILLGIVSFLTDVSSEMIMPVLPLFITALGGGGLIVGLIGGLSDSVSSILKVASGYWSDKIGRKKPFVFLGYGVSAISKLLFPFALVWQHVLALRVFERVGKGVRTAPRDAIIAASVEKKKRGLGFGIHRAMDSSGAVIGSILALLLFVYLGFDFRTIFLAAGVIAIFALLPIIPVRERQVRQNISLKVSMKSLSKPLKIFIATATVFAFGNFSYMFFILRAQSSFAEGIAVVLFLYVIYNIFYALFSVPVGILSDKVGRRNVLLFGYSLFALTCLGFAFLQDLLFFVMLFILYGIVLAFTDATERAFVSDLAEKNIRGTALGTFHTAISVATLPASIIAGTLWEIVSPAATFLYGSSMAFIAVFILLMTSRFFE